MQVCAQEFAAIGHAEPGALEQPGYDVRLGEEGRLRLRIWGDLPASWPASLGVGLYESGIRVVRGAARRAGPGGGPDDPWLAEFELEVLDDAADPVLLDYLGLARRSPEDLSPPEVRITSHHRSLTAKYGGAVYLEVAAADRLGFMGGLLARIAQIGLVPEELEIDTLGAPVFDRFFLKGVDGSAPVREARARLCHLMDRLSSP